MPIDYSKWKEIEVSDDEDDTHPNIDTPSLFRWRHQARLERMAEQKQKQEALDKEKDKVKSESKEIEKKLKESAAELTDAQKADLEKKKAELDKQNAEFYKKEAELQAELARQPWNVDTIGTEKFSKSRINKVTEKKPEPPKVNEEDDAKRMTEYFKTNESILQSFGKLTDRKASEEFLLENPRLASEYAANYLTIEALNLAIEEKDEPMKVMARQTVLLQYLLELSKSLNALATNTNVIKNFFKKFNAADPSYLKMYDEEVAAFEDRLRQRARTKREAAIAEYEAEEKEKRVQAAPGGLDPQEVFESLPEVMRTAFESQDVGALQAVASEMDQEVFLHHLNRCIASGLWVPNKEDAEAAVGDEQKETTEEAT